MVPEPPGPAGSLIIPPPADVGWYQAGPAPGEPGTTVLAGHIDDYGVEGAFLRLSQVPRGATVVLGLSGGSRVSYVVTRRLLLPQGQLSVSGLLRSTGSPSLVLLSCGGGYDSSTHLYLDNVVLVAQQISPAG